jgi:drug/metabolite transporter (DMT)-like permease
MPPPLLAATAALFFASGYVVSRRALSRATVLSGLVLSLAATWLVTVVAVAFDPPASVNRGAVALFAASGLIAPGISRVADLTGVQRLGPSVSVPIQAGTRPLLSVVGGVLVLGESLEPRLALGVTAIVTGLWNLSWPAGRGAVADARPNPRLRSLLRPGITFPLIAGAAFAASDVVKKRSLDDAADPTFGAMVAIAAALGFWVVATLASPRIRAHLRFGPGSHLFLGSGSLTALAVLSLFHALEHGDVSVVGPISSSSPLAVFALSAIFLKDLETIAVRTLLSGMAIVVGASLVATS